jgi:hypothetical protein
MFRDESYPGSQRVDEARSKSAPRHEAVREFLKHHSIKLSIVDLTLKHCDLGVLDAVTTEWDEPCTSLLCHDIVRQVAERQRPSTFSRTSMMTLMEGGAPSDIDTVRYEAASTFTLARCSADHSSSVSDGRWWEQRS